MNANQFHPVDLQKMTVVMVSFCLVCVYQLEYDLSDLSDLNDLKDWRDVKVIWVFHQQFDCLKE